MNERKKLLPIISLLLAGVGFIFISSAPIYNDEQIGFGIIISLIGFVCAVISLFKKEYKKLWAIIGIIICIFSTISFINFSNKREQMLQEQLERARTTHIITFDSDGGSYVEPMIVNMETWLVEPTEPIKDGYVFDGWSYNGEKFSFNRYADNYVTTDITLKAVWLKEQTSNLTNSGHNFNNNNNSNTGNNNVNNNYNSNTGNLGSSNNSSSGITNNTPTRGYQQIYDEYAKKLRDAGPTSSISEMAEICNDGVYEMARYMYSAKGTDGQYATYEQWAGKLYDVYMKEVR